MNSLRGVVDIGSNGVRLSINDLSDVNGGRNLPIIFQERAKISLYDALAGSVDHRIPHDVLRKLHVTLVRFDRVCNSLNVANRSVTVFATEVAREATNSDDLISSIKSINPGWEVSILSPRIEAIYGVLGVASSFYETKGIVMDLGGGSLQVSWINTSKEEFSMSDSPVSIPYGAAALTQKLKTQQVSSLKNEIVQALQAAVEKIKLPFSSKGLNIYLSGGGFRALGCLSMSLLAEDHYPVPIINGYQCSIKDLERVVQKQINAEVIDRLEDYFRISKRRAVQLPAILVIVQALINVLPNIGSINFCQGGVKEGYLFSTLPESCRLQDPLLVGTKLYARPGAPGILSLMECGMPKSAPAYITQRLLPAVVNMMYYHSTNQKDTQATAALTVAVSGSLSGVLGFTHVDRALLGIILCERWGGDVYDERLIGKLCDLVVTESRGGRGYSYMFWGYFVAKFANLVGSIYPIGVIDDRNRIRIQIERDEVEVFTLRLTFLEDDEATLAIWDKIDTFEKRVNKFRKKYGVWGVPKLHVKIDVE
ncbi:Ppx/GppA phosphatase family-domain-containing protein [Dipodascopsis uninucleata]